MNTSKPVVGLVFLIGLAIVTGGAGLYTFLLPPQSNCVAPLQPVIVDATAHQWGFIINGTDATKNGWKTICHGTTVTFKITGMWEHDPVNGFNYTQHGFQIEGLMNSPAIINQGIITTVTVTFDTRGVFTLKCTQFCGEILGIGGHSTMNAQITIL